MNHGSGIKDRDDRSNVIEILMTDDFFKINPADSFILVKQCEENEVDPIPPVVTSSLVRSDVSW
jgi:hypothetical protein